MQDPKMFWALDPCKEAMLPQPVCRAAVLRAVGLMPLRAGAQGFKGHPPRAWGGLPEDLSQEPSEGGILSCHPALCTPW